MRPSVEDQGSGWTPIPKPIGTPPVATPPIAKDDSGMISPVKQPRPVEVKPNAPAVKPAVQPTVVNAASASMLKPDWKKILLIAGIAYVGLKMFKGR